MEIDKRKNSFYLSKKAFIIYLILVFISIIIKIPFLFYFYKYGYIPRDFNVLNNDCYYYVQHAINHDINYFTFGDHWLYEYINSLVYTFTQNPDLVYLYMSILNIILSSLLPLIFIPAIHSLIQDKQKKDRCFIILTTLILFWPTAIFLSVQNFKDIILALLVSLFITIYLSNKEKLHFKHLLVLILLTYLLYSLRTYLAAILIITTLLHFIITKKSVRTIIIVSICLLLFYLSPIWNNIQNFMDLTNNWLFNQQALEIYNTTLIAQGSPPMELYNTPITFLYGFVRSIFNPLPTLIIDQPYNYLLCCRSIILSFLLLFFIIQLKKWHGSIKIWLLCIMLIQLCFYAYNPTFSGPRQLFPGVDLLFIFMISYLLVQRRTNSILILSFGTGLILTSIFLVFTSRTWLIF